MWEGGFNTPDLYKTSTVTHKIKKTKGVVDTSQIVSGVGGITPSQTIGSFIGEQLEELKEEVAVLRKENKLLAEYIYRDLKKKT